MSNVAPSPSIGELLREWRAKRRMSQLALAAEAQISQKHLSFLESGRSIPSREMVMRLAEQLMIPLRQRNQLLVAAGFAPHFVERRLDDPLLASARQAVRQVLAAHEPNPAFAIDRLFNLIDANTMVVPFLETVEEPALLKPPLNVMRLCLHPRGLAPHIVNLSEWRDHLFVRLRRQTNLTGDPVFEDLERELMKYPVGPRTHAPVNPEIALVANPLCIRLNGGILTFIGTLSVFGNAVDVTLSEIAIESFFPADDRTAEIVRHLRDQRRGR